MDAESEAYAATLVSAGRLARRAEVVEQLQLFGLEPLGTNRVGMDAGHDSGCLRGGPI